MKTNNTPKISNTVGYNLLKIVFSLYVIIALLMTFIHMYSEYNNEQNVIFEEMKNIEKISKKQLTTSLWHFEVSLTQDIINGILISRSIVGLSIRSKGDEIVGNFGIVDISKKSDKSISFTYNDEPTYASGLYLHTFMLTDARYDGGKSLGEVTLYSNDTVVFNRVKNNFLFIIINSIIKTFALWIIFLIIAKKYLTKPFFEIIDFTNTIDFGQLKDTKFEYQKNNENEFDILKKTFNQMFKRLNISNDKYIKLNEELEQKVLKRTYELEESNDELETSIANLKLTQKQLIESEKMASLGSLVAGVAHEINTPIGAGLSGISHFLEKTKEIKKNYESENMSAEEFEGYLSTSNRLAEMININLERTAHLVKSFKQIAVDQTNEEKRGFNFKEYLNKIIFSLTNITKIKKIKINITCKDDLIISSYPGLYSQIITNLIINSIKHGFKEKMEGTITIDVLENNNNLEIIYKDDGIGISKENLEKIFEPFFTTNRENGGTGLGMNIVYNIVTNNLKGAISCDSIKSDGVIFKILVPLNEEEILIF